MQSFPEKNSNPSDDRIPFRFVIICCDESIPSYKKDHGLSILIAPDPEPPYLLLDTGSNPQILVHNLLTAGYALDSVQAIAISHGHYDHTGGLAAFQNSDKPPFLYCSPHITQKRYSVVGKEARPIGLPESIELQRFPTSPITQTRLIWPRVHAITPIDKVTDFEICRDPLCLDKDGIIPDPFHDEIALVAEIENGLIVFSGCGHRGIVNTVITALKEFGKRDNIIVVGGFHLRHSPPDIVEKTATSLIELGVSTVMAGHCTGTNTYPIFREYFGENFIPLQAGNGYSMQ